MNMENNRYSRRDILGGVVISAASLGVGVALGSRLTSLGSQLLGENAELGLRYNRSSKVALAYHPFLNSHQRFGHPEGPPRTDAGLEGIRNLQKTEAKVDLFPLSRPTLLEKDPKSLLGVVHTSNYIDTVQSEIANAEFLTKSRWSPYGGQSAFSAAVLAAALTTDLSRKISDGELNAGFALVRPPGHHAGANFSGGYCLFNNVAIAAASVAGERKIAIVDLDVHHGDGSQDIFYRNPNILYASIHQDEWPYTGALEKTGEGPGLGSNINVPLPVGAGDRAWQEALTKVVLPALKRFAPEMIFVSMGFDTHWRDPQGSMNLSSNGQASMLGSLKTLADEISSGKICVVLEGGYQTEVLEAGAANVIKVLTNHTSGFWEPFGLPPVPNDEQALSEKAERVIATAMKIHGL